MGKVDKRSAKHGKKRRRRMPQKGMKLTSLEIEEGLYLKIKIAMLCTGETMASVLRPALEAYSAKHVAECGRCSTMAKYEIEMASRAHTVARVSTDVGLECTVCRTVEEVEVLEIDGIKVPMCSSCNENAAMMRAENVAENG
jgi:hypothetical protein